MKVIPARPASPSGQLLLSSRTTHRGDTDNGMLMTNALFTSMQLGVAFGRLFISNPDLVEKLQAGAPLQAPDPNTFYTPGDTDYLA